MNDDYMIVDVNTCFGQNPADSRDRSLELLDAILNKHNVHRAMTYSLRGVLYDFVSGNEETLAVCEGNERLIPVATIDPRRHFGCLDEVERCVDRGVGTFRFFPDEQGWTIDSEPFMRICEEIAGAGASVMLPAGPAGHQSLIAERIVPFGFPIVICGAGYATNAETIAVVASHENVFCESHLINTPGTIEGLVWVAGPGALLFGSNSPDRYFGAARHMVECAELDDDIKARIFAHNAIESLRLGDLV
ncbi:MAG: amidohydrolase family protein [Armatimonadota bacterium]